MAPQETTTIWSSTRYDVQNNTIRADIAGDWKIYRDTKKEEV